MQPTNADEIPILIMQSSDLDKKPHLRQSLFHDPKSRDASGNRPRKRSKAVEK